jgi:predicted PurR-regulated permease PerM
LAQPDRFVTRVFGLAVAAVLAYALYRIFRPFFGPLYWAFLLGFLLFPLNRWVRGRMGGRNGAAALLLTLAVTVGIMVPAGIATALFARQAVELGQGLAERADEYKVSGVEDVLALPVIGRVLEWLEQRLSLDPARVRQAAVEAVQNAIHFLLTHGRAALFGTLGFIADFFVTLFVLFFLFRDGDAIVHRVKRLIPFDEKRKETLARRLEDVTRAVFYGTVVTAIAQGILLGLGFWISGLPSPVVFGALAAVASFIPFVGTGLIWVPAVIYLFVQGVVWKVIFLAVWSFLVVGSADNFLRPLLVSGRAQIGTLSVFFGVLGGLAAFGFIGLFLGPVILAFVLALIQFAEESPAAPAMPPAPPPASP